MLIEWKKNGSLKNRKTLAIAVNICMKAEQNYTDKNGSYTFRLKVNNPVSTNGLEWHRLMN